MGLDTDIHNVFALVFPLRYLIFQAAGFTPLGNSPSIFGKPGSRYGKSVTKASMTSTELAHSFPSFLSFHSLSSRKHLLIPHALLTCTLFLQQIDQQCRPSSCTKFRVPLRGTELSANLPRRLHATAVSFLAHFLPYSPGRLPVWHSQL